MSELVHATFAPLVGEPFELAPPAGEPFTAVLAACDLSPHGAADGASREPFTLEFTHEGAGGYWPQQIFTVRHPQAGSFDLFLVPLGPDERGMRYEAVIS